MTVQEVVEGRQKQGIDEELCYKITTTPWGSSPTGVEVKAYVGENNMADVTDLVFPTNEPEVVGDVITLSPAKNLGIGIVYKIETKFTIGSNLWECLFELEGI